MSEESPLNLANDQQTAFEAAAYRRLLAHLRTRNDVQNIDLMNLAGFCRNCLSNWFLEAAQAAEVSLKSEDVREMVYGMPQAEWKARYQKEASGPALEKFEKTKP